MSSACVHLLASRQAKHAGTQADEGTLAVGSIPRTPKGLAPIPGQRDADEQTLSMIVALTSEVTVIRARLDTCERLLVENGVLDEGAIEGLTPDAGAQAERDLLRKRTLEKVFRTLQESGEAELAARKAQAE